jgi:hypothetical protein
LGSGIIYTNCGPTVAFVVATEVRKEVLQYDYKWPRIRTTTVLINVIVIVYIYICMLALIWPIQFIDIYCGWLYVKETSQDRKKRAEFDH